MTDYSVDEAHEKQKQIALVCDSLRDYADTKDVDSCGLCREAADIIERLALWEDMGPRQADAIVMLTERIAFLEALISETNTYYAECIDTREEFRARIAAMEAAGGACGSVRVSIYTARSR